MSTLIATTVKATTLQTSAGGTVTLTKQSAAKAWCNFETISHSMA